jgi:hypothetical protein
MTQRNSLFILLGVFVALLVLVFFRARPSTPTESSAPQSTATITGSLFTWRTTDIQAFSIRDPYSGVTLSFQRNNSGQWESVEVPEAIPDQTGVDQVALTISLLPALEALNQVKVEDYPEFGLTQTDAFLILIALLKNGEQHTVIIGDVAPGNVSHYALVDDRPEVYVIDARPVAYLVSLVRQVYQPELVPTAETATEVPITAP